MADADVRLIDSGPAFEIWKGPKGGMRLDWTKRGAVRFAVQQYAYTGYAAPILKRWTGAIPMAEHGKVLFLLDFWDMDGYDSQFRIETQTWGRVHQVNLGKVALLTRSKLVSMGAAAANLAIGGMLKTFTQKAEFERECTRAGFTNTPFTL